MSRFKQFDFKRMNFDFGVYVDAIQLLEDRSDIRPAQLVAVLARDYPSVRYAAGIDEWYRQYELGGQVHLPAGAKGYLRHCFPPGCRLPYSIRDRLVDQAALLAKRLDHFRGEPREPPLFVPHLGIQLASVAV